MQTDGLMFLPDAAALTLRSKAGSYQLQSSAGMPYLVCLI